MSSVIIAGNTSGTITLDAPNVAGTTTLTLPTTSGTVVTSANISTYAPSPAGGATTTSSAVDITLTSSSNKVQDVTMTAADKAVILPDATTISTLGASIFVINNRGGITFHIKNNSGVIIAVVQPFASVQLSLTSNATSNGTWAKQEGDIFFGQYLPSQVTSDKIQNYGGATYAPTYGADYQWSADANSYVVVKKISSTTALILWSPLAANSNSTVTLMNLKAVVATVSNGSISYGTPVTVYTGTTNGLTNFSAVVLSSTAALILVEKGATTASVVYPLVLSGSTITVGTASATFGLTTGNYQRNGSIVYLSSTTAMLSYISTAGDATGVLAARVVTHTGATAPTLSTAVTLNANATTLQKLIPLTSTTVQWLYFVRSTGILTTSIITSNGSSSAPSLGTALSTTVPYYGINMYQYNFPVYAYSYTETSILLNDLIQVSFTISGTTITQQAITPIRYYNNANGLTNVAGTPVQGNIAWFTSTQGVMLKPLGTGGSPVYIPVSYTSGTGVNYGFSNITHPTINGLPFGQIEQLDSSTAMAVMSYGDGVQAQVVTLL
jgi:hypothetical protein